jgi:hypothetical protein
VGTWTFALRCHPAISWTNRIIFSAVASSNAAKVFNTTFNHCVFTLGIKYQWVFPVFGSTKPYTYNHWYLGSTTALCLSPTGDHSFFNIGFNPILCSSKNQTYIWAWGYFYFSYFTFNGSFFLTLFELVPPLFYVYISVSARSNRTFLESHPLWLLTFCLWVSFSIHLATFDTVQIPTSAGLCRSAAINFCHCSGFNKGCFPRRGARLFCWRFLIPSALIRYISWQSFWHIDNLYLALWHYFLLSSLQRLSRLNLIFLLLLGLYWWDTYSRLQVNRVQLILVC